MKFGITPAPGHRIGASFFESRLNQQFDGSEFAPPDFLQDASPDFRNRLVTRVGALDYRGELGHALDDEPAAVAQRGRPARAAAT